MKCLNIVEPPLWVHDPEMLNRWVSTLDNFCVTRHILYFVHDEKIACLGSIIYNQKIMCSICPPSPDPLEPRGLFGMVLYKLQAIIKFSQ